MRGSVASGNGAFAALALLGFAACADSQGPGAADAGDDLTATAEVLVLALRAPQPMLPGSRIAVELDAPLVRDASTPLRLSNANAVRELAWDEASGAYALTADDIDSLGVGPATLGVSIGGDLQSRAVPFEVELADSLPVVVDSTSVLEGGPGAMIVLYGSGFLAPGEGTCVAVWQGDYAATTAPLDVPGPSPGSGFRGSAPLGEPVFREAIEPVTLVEPHDRIRAITAIPLAVTGIEPGEFVGSVQVRCDSVTGTARFSEVLDTVVSVGWPVALQLGSATVRIGSYLDVYGVGFVAGDGVSTLMRLQGSFASPGGESAPIGPIEVAGLASRGEVFRMPLVGAERDKELVSEIFGAPRGTFTGTITPIVTDGTRRLVGHAADVTIELQGPRQVVQVVFLPGFRSSLRDWGLTEVALEVERRIVERIAALYDGLAIEFVAELPDDADPRQVSRVEIGGPDPNGIGLFGFDNSVGKDVGNLRLFDVIGGANAETQEDGFPGFGGVFVESMLWWSTHPPQELPPPRSRPTPDPLFDEVFDPIRNEPVRLAELRGGSKRERVAAVDRALRAFVYLVAETAAHEIGHSLGLAEPYGPGDVFHPTTDGPGCLMDLGENRPFGERAGEPGFAPTQFCGDDAAYLREVLGEPSAPE